VGAKAPNKRLSVRLVWPFVRVVGVDPPTADLFARAGYAFGDFASADARIPNQLVMDALRSYVARTGDETVGLRAGASVDPADLEPLELAARSCATLRHAIEFVARYILLMNEAAAMSLIESGDNALWRFQATDGIPQVPAANDFIVATACTFSKRCAGLHEPALEVHLMHSRPAYASVYEGVFATRVRFDMPHNGFLLRRETLERAMPRAEPKIQEIFESRLSAALIDRAPGIRHEVTTKVVSQLPTGRLSMTSVASQMHMSVATLRRRLGDQGATFGEIVQETRRALAETHLRSAHLSVREVAFMLGFAHVPAFNAAFRKWTGTTPSAFRARLLEPDAKASADR
jgi:AraC-like DNA-binding protein